jgi:hypothetical protein
LLSNRKLTGRKRIAFDNNVHKIAILSDELENEIGVFVLCFGEHLEKGACN